MKVTVALAIPAAVHDGAPYAAAQELGLFKEQGMPDFKGKLKPEDVSKLQAFIQGTADAIRPKPAAAASAAK